MLGFIKECFSIECFSKECFFSIFIDFNKSKFVELYFNEESRM